MHFFDTNDTPPLYAGIAAVSLLILTGLTLVGTAVALTFMIPIFVVLSPILVPAVITLSFLATGLLASGNFGASGIALLLCLYKKEEHSRYNMHVRGVRPDGANKLARGSKLPRGDKSTEKDNPLEGDKQGQEDKPLGKDKPSEEDKPPEGYKLVEEVQPSERDKSVEVKPAEEHSPPRKEKYSERGKPTEEDQPLGVKQVSIPEISKVLFVEQKPIGLTCCGPSTSSKRSHQIRFAMDPTKVRSIFMKECQKVPRVGAFAYKYFTSRDKKYINHIHNHI